MDSKRSLEYLTWMDSKRMWSMNESYNEIEQKEEDLYVPVNTVTSPTTEPVASGVTKQTTYKFLYKKSTVFLSSIELGYSILAVM